MSDQILSNPAALGALKRHQLVSLSKRYGLKASGKNIDMIDRLQEYAASMGPELQLYLPEPPSTPARALDDLALSDPPSPAPHSPLPSLVGLMPQTEGRFRSKRGSVLLKPKRESETWEVLSTSGASLISPMKGILPRDGSVSSWKSAGNGERLDEFGAIAPERESHSTSSRSKHMLDIASSLKRCASRTLLFGHSSSHSSNLSAVDSTRPGTPEIQERVPSIAPSPASTVGVPRRHSKITLLQRPSTIRLCSPAPPDAMSLAGSEDEDHLPFPGTPAKWQALKERRSVGPLHASGATHTGLNRKSMPALPYSSFGSSPSIYPPIPGVAGIPPLPPLPAMPGTWGPSPTKAPASPLKFGDAAAGISKEKFSEAAEAVLREMNAKLPEGAKMINEELLRGKKAEMGRLVSTDASLGEGGWGLSTSQAGRKDRNADVHEREFKKMKSITASIRTKTTSISSVAPSLLTIPATPGVKRKHSLEQFTAGPSAPNGGTLDGQEPEPKSKKTKVSVGPGYLGSLRSASRNLANLLGEATTTTQTEEAKVERKEVQPMTPAMARRIKEKKEKDQAKGFGSKFGFLRRKATVVQASTNEPIRKPERALNKSTSTTLQGSLRSAALPQSSLYRKPTQTHLRRRSTELVNLIKPSPELPEAIDLQTKVQRKTSTGASTILSNNSKTYARAPIPDFGASIAGNKNSLGLPKPKADSGSSGKSMRKASQADIIRNARQVPLPPLSTVSLGSKVVPIPATPRVPSGNTVPSTIKRNSTLLQPTAASLARMQATVKPPASRPLPAIPPPAAITTSKPFGPGASRDNLFESTFNAVPDFSASTTTLGSVHSPPATTSTAGKAFPKSSATPKKRAGMQTPGRSPLRPTSLAASRARSRPGASNTKSRANLRSDIDMTRRRAEIKARTERMGEERQLRAMLSTMGGSGGDENVDSHAF